ncbi:MAG: hypothetical protein AAGB01_05250, partial [Cyanobacteria bacterium P01_F01_bin.42]
MGLQFELEQTYAAGESITLGGLVFDGDGYEDLVSVDWWLLNEEQFSWNKLPSRVAFGPQPQENRWASFEQTLSSLAAGTYWVWGRVQDASGNRSNFVRQSFQVLDHDSAAVAPSLSSFDFDIEDTFNVGEKISITNGWVLDDSSYTDIQSVNWRLRDSSSNWVDLPDSVSFSPGQRDGRWGNFEKTLSFLSAGTYTLWGQAEDKSGNKSNIVQKSFQVINTAPSTLIFDVPNTVPFGESISVFDGWVHDENGAVDVTKIDWRLRDSTGQWTDISDSEAVTPYPLSWNWGSFDKSLTGLEAGEYVLWGQAHDRSGAVGTPVTKSFTVEAPESQAFNIEFDYRFDTQAWFTSERREVLEAAAQIWENIILDEFDDIPIGTETPFVKHPEDVQFVGEGNIFTVDREIDDLLIFPGSRSIRGAASAGPSGSTNREPRYRGN